MLWKRQITFLFFGHLLIMAALDMSDPYWPLIIGHANILSPAEIQYWSAAIYVAPLIATIITTPIFGFLGTKIGQKKMLLRAGIAIAITQLCIAFTVNPLVLVSLRLLQGLFAGFTAAAQAWAVAIAPGEFRGYVLGKLQAATAIGTILGPLIGGLAAKLFNYSAIFIISTIICIGTIIVLTILLQETKKITKEFTATAMKNFWGLTPYVVYILVLIGLIQMARWMITPFFALYVSQRLGGEQISVGILYSITALTIFLSAFAWGHLVDRQIAHTSKIAKIFIVNLLVAAIIHFLLAEADNFYWVLILRLLLGINLSAITIIPLALLVRQAHAAHQGSIVGFSNSALKLGNLLGVVLGALIQAHLNFTFSFIIIGLIYIALALVLWIKPIKFTVPINN